MVTGEDVICRMIEDESGTWFHEPMYITLKQNKSGTISILMDHWLPIELVSDNITRVNSRNIISVFDANRKISEYYTNTMKKVNDILVMKTRMKEMEEDGEDMDDVMSALEESQGVLLH
jgi:hypothetical protein